MTAIKRSRTVLLSLTLAAASLLGVFAILHASSANASLGEVPPIHKPDQPDIIISPSELETTLYINTSLTQTLWITNTAEYPITYTIYELTAPLKTGGDLIAPAAFPIVDPAAQRQVDTWGKAPIIIRLRQVPDLSSAYLIHDKLARRQFVYSRLLENAGSSQSLFSWLASQDTKPLRLLSSNAIAATVNGAQLSILAKNPSVRQIIPDQQVTKVEDHQSPLGLALLPAITTVAPGTVEWNIAMIRADEAWSTFGITGQGAVVGIMDSGVMYDHPALVNSYRGNLGEGSFDHNYNWFDFMYENPVPEDNTGHGTMLAGIVTGDDGVNNQIGVAPGADWIAAKVCDTVCPLSAISQAFDWMLAPYDLNHTNPDPTKAPDIVLGGWGGGSCDDSWQFQFMALRAAGILPVFPGGHSGPGCESIGSPGDQAGVLTAGMTDQNDSVAEVSPRGPSCYGSIKPDVTAPGVNIRSSFNDGGYATWSGSAESSAHVAGVAALMISADPNLNAGVLEPILYSTSVCHDDLTCGGEACPGPNNVYGHGRIDAFEAVYRALGYPNHTDLPWLTENPTDGAIQPGETAEIAVVFDATGLAAGSFTGALGILTNDPQLPLTTLPVTMVVTSTCQSLGDILVGYIPDDPEVGEAVNFSASANGTLPISYTWSFEDGSTAFGPGTTFTFTQAGIHVVGLETANSCTSPISVEINIPVTLKLKLPAIFR